MPLTKLVVNTKLALPGLMLLARACFYEDINDDVTTIKYLLETIKSFKRIDVETDSLKRLSDELFFGEASEESITTFRKTLAKVVKSLRADNTANQSIIELYLAVSGALANDERHFTIIRNRVSVLALPDLTAYFPVTVDTSAQATHLGFVSAFDANQIAELRDNKDPKYKEILSARKAGRDIVSDYIKQYCRDSNKTLVDYDTLLKAINKLQLVHTLPQGFVGYIDEFSQLHTIYGKKISGFPSNAIVVMNSSYTKDDSCYVFTARTDKAISTTYFYTQDYKNSSKQNKFEVVEKLSKCIDTIRSKWLKKLTIKDPQFQEAMVLELIYHTQARIGSTNNATLDKRSGKYLRTYGMSTILLKHYTVETDHVIFEYPGKAAFKGDNIHMQRHKFYPDSKETNLIFDWLKNQKKLDENDKLFSTSADRVRELLKDLGAPEGASVHKLRTLKGTLMMKERIKKHPFKQQKGTATSVNKWIKEQALDVGIQLGHMSGEKYTATTAIAHYIDPVAMLRLFRDAGIAPPRNMLKLVGIDNNSIEIIR